MDYKLHRGQQGEKFNFDRAIKSVSSTKHPTIRNPKFDKASNNQMPALPGKIVALVHFGRSGTGLLHSLIDGHPEVSTLPSIYFSEYFDYSTWVQIISAGWGGMIDRFIEIYEVLFDDCI